MAGFTNKFESTSEEWETPDNVYLPLAEEFVFDRDVAASSQNAKTLSFFSKSEDGLLQEWTGTCWMNPPFGRQLKHWVIKAYESSEKGAVVVCLLPAKTNTNWWHDYCMKGEIRFLRGRPKFNGAKHGLPFPLAIVIFGKR